MAHRTVPRRRSARGTGTHRLLRPQEICELRITQSLVAVYIHSSENRINVVVKHYFVVASQEIVELVPGNVAGTRVVQGRKRSDHSEIVSEVQVFFGQFESALQAEFFVKQSGKQELHVQGQARCGRSLHGQVSENVAGGGQG